VITKEQFLSNCKPRFGAANPERIHNLIWEWMIRTNANPWWVREDFGLELNHQELTEDRRLIGAPDWCFKRFGMSETRMPDGRIICIGGEHEDWYDPNFCIYNDVVVLRPAPGKTALSESSGEVEIYGYPRDVFAPTDFHSATLVVGHIYIIGRLGYLEDRSVPSTPVYRLDTDSYRIEQLSTSGSSPGLIHEHHAEFEPETNSILVRGGRLDAPGTRELPWNHAVHRLHLSDGRWELIREHERHRRFLLETDGRYVELTLEDVTPRSLPCVVVHVDDEVVPRFKLSINGTRFTFEQAGDVTVLIEGDMAESMLAVVLREVLANLGDRSGAEWTATEVSVFDAP